jgi:hypothetical protein
MAIPTPKNTGVCAFPYCTCVAFNECGNSKATMPTKPMREGDQPMPTPNDKAAVWPIVMADMQARHELGIKRYGTPLQPFNGRDALRDAYEEALDLAVYLRTAIYERDGQ